MNTYTTMHHSKNYSNHKLDISQSTQLSTEYHKKKYEVNKRTFKDTYRQTRTQYEREQHGPHNNNS